MSMTTKKNKDGNSFDYHLAFSRNIGWLTRREQAQLKNKCVAIAGGGGVGGIYLLTLVRLGIENFHIADFDDFELQNFNRQVGANMHTLHRNKIEVLKDMAEEINPQVKIKCFMQGVTNNNIEDFLRDADIYLDGLDFFVLDMREQIFKRCDELNIPAITAAPVGMGCAYLSFMPGKMVFEQYFQLAGLSPLDKQINFFLGLTPKPFHTKYLVDTSTFDFNAKKAPSTMMACNLCAGIASTEVLKILLNRSPIEPAPYYHYFDAYHGKAHRGRAWLGNRNPLTKFKRSIIKNKMLKPKAPSICYTTTNSNDAIIKQILDIARWAPSGDNQQPWRFEIVDDQHAIIHLKDDAENHLYDHDGIPTLISSGMLLETIRLAANHFDYDIKWTYKKQKRPHFHKIEVSIKKSKVVKDTLYDVICYRSVDRFQYRTTPLTKQQKQKLAAALGDRYSLKWYESFKERWQASKLNFATTDLRLRIPEMFEVHRKVIDVDHPYSEYGIPIQAAGFSKLTQWLLKPILNNQFLLKVMNVLGAPYLSGMEVDMLPGLACGAHFDIYCHDKNEFSDAKSIIEFGMSLQRFWLTATQLGLVMQPTYSAIMFTYYVNHKVKFTKSNGLVKKAQRIARRFKILNRGKFVIYRGRIGIPRTPISHSRSIRKPLKDLMIDS